MLSPLLALIGQYLLFATDVKVGLRQLVDFLYNKDTELRVQFHNWYLLENAVGSATEQYGPKVNGLEFSLFPTTDCTLMELSAKVLGTITKNSVSGGSAQPSVSEKMFASGDSVLLPVFLLSPTCGRRNIGVSREGGSFPPYYNEYNV